jgi:UDP-glucose 4-epimerase
MHIFITGGAGYIGSHTALLLLERGNEVTVLDSLVNSSVEAIKRVEKITRKKINFIHGDIRNFELLNEIFSNNSFDAIIHFAGLKSVGQSVSNPLSYYANNVAGSINLFKAISKFSCKTIIFSSSATVYGDPLSLPITELDSCKPTNPYGQNKLMVEQILQDLYISDSNWNIARLRYFNPVGAHFSGLIGEDPRGIPNNLMPYISMVASGTLDKLSIFGNDYPTLDGTGVRDYIHVMDLASGHLAALDHLVNEENGKLLTVNLGTGRGYSVLELLHAFEKASKKTIPYEFVDRRPGDIATCFADTTMAKNILGWSAQFEIYQMCEDTWNWQKNNPKGYL